jgi:hypothetical protein
MVESCEYLVTALPLGHTSNLGCTWRGCSLYMHPPGRRPAPSRPAAPSKYGSTAGSSARPATSGPASRAAVPDDPFADRIGSARPTGTAAGRPAAAPSKPRGMVIAAEKKKEVPTVDMLMGTAGMEGLPAGVGRSGVARTSMVYGVDSIAKNCMCFSCHLHHSKVAT